MHNTTLVVACAAVSGDKRCLCQLWQRERRGITFFHDEDVHIEVEIRQLQIPESFRREPVWQALKLFHLRQVAVLLLGALAEFESISHRGIRTRETHPRCPVASMTDGVLLFFAVCPPHAYQHPTRKVTRELRVALDEVQLRKLPGVSATGKLEAADTRTIAARHSAAEGSPHEKWHGRRGALRRPSAIRPRHLLTVRLLLRRRRLLRTSD